MKVKLEEIKISRLNDRDLQSTDSLVESIRDIGLIEPIVINEKKEILSGRRRFLACKKLKLKEVECSYYDKSKIDSDLAVIDSNLLFLPLSSVDHDLALSKRKVLYLQKYPETRQYGANLPGQISFTKEVSTVLGINQRTVERAISRAEKATHMVTQARRDKNLSPGIVDNLVRLPPTYQDTLLPEIEGKSISEIKHIVDVALKKDINFALVEAHKKSQVFTSLEMLEKNLLNINLSLNKCLKIKYKYSQEMIHIIKSANEVMDNLDKFIDQNTPHTAPILRKQSHMSA